MSEIMDKYWDEVALKTLLMPPRIRTSEFLTDLGIEPTDRNRAYLLMAWNRLGIFPHIVALGVG